MIFACGKCRTRYKLPDEKVRGRVLRVRCKSCGAVVHVRDPALPAASAPQAPASEAEWFVAIRGRQHGPMTLSSVLSLFQDGTVTTATYAWREGMGSWLKIAEIEILRSLFSAASSTRFPPSSGVSFRRQLRVSADRLPPAASAACSGARVAAPPARRAILAAI